ncbi:aromatic ring-hydroxylating oxygenase subunit alpha [Comamonas guangdongensis]|uniref:Aromatic ring-hydroxylating dioxygenase subunit alpha n=1 Tax=Comamonas guangdongensis TaxID=510515 RepID=A0ABV3ZXA7_9BURK
MTAVSTAPLLPIPSAVSLHARARAAVAQSRADAQGRGGQVAVDDYRSPMRFAQELQMFRRHPQAVAASQSLADPGSWLSLTHLGTPLLLVRQADGELQAFLNVCRHRGARLVPEGSGENARAFVCPYHAWTYRADGGLRGLPQAEGFPCLKPEESGLRRLAAAEKAGLVWVILDPEHSDREPATMLEPLISDLAGLAGMQTPLAFAPRSHEVQANWKLLVDGIFEAYHFKVAHRQTIAAMFAGNVQLVDEAGLHRRLYLIKSNFAQDLPGAEGFEPRRYGNLTYFFFPNNLVLVQPDHAQFSCIEPLSPTRSRIHEITLIPEAPATDKAVKYWQANVDLYRRTLAEDYALAESIQQGLASGANEVFNFGSYEYSIPRFHAQLAQQLDPKH